MRGIKETIMQTTVSIRKSISSWHCWSSKSANAFSKPSFSINVLTKVKMDADFVTKGLAIAKNVFYLNYYSNRVSY